MRRPHRRLHLVIWLLVAPIVAAGLLLALRNTPAAPIAEIDDALISQGGE